MSRSALARGRYAGGELLQPRLPEGELWQPSPGSAVERPRLRAAEWEVRPVGFSELVAFTSAHHYAAAGSNSATAADGLWHRASGQLHGITWWIPTTKDAARAAARGTPYQWRQVLALSRLCLSPGAPANAATFLLMASVRRLPERWPLLVTWADTRQGHTGHIYRAAGWEYLGLSSRTDAWLLDGRLVARKAGGHTRTVAEMRALGAELLGYFPKHRYRFIRDPRARRQAASAVVA